MLKPVAIADWDRTSQHRRPQVSIRMARELRLQALLSRARARPCPYPMALLQRMRLLNLSDHRHPLQRRQATPANLLPALRRRAGRPTSSTSAQSEPSCHPPSCLRANVVHLSQGRHGTGHRISRIGIITRAPVASVLAVTILSRPRQYLRSRQDQTSTRHNGHR